MFYVSNYMGKRAKDGSEKFVQARSSQGWVFPGSVRYYHDCKREYGVAPSQGAMVSMAKLPDEERERELDLAGRGYERFDAEMRNDFARTERQGGGRREVVWDEKKERFVRRGGGYMGKPVYGPYYDPEIVALAWGGWP